MAAENVGVDVDTDLGWKTERRKFLLVAKISVAMVSRFLGQSSTRAYIASILDVISLMRNVFS